mmetsp:Transcript_6148/g.10420  ORF Transcript_6148/g.10420 Transcript_6148/m.10420 type:complete len:105 (-) Transcript_6148:1316-1630(-)
MSLMPSQVVSSTTTEEVVADPIISSTTPSLIDTAPCAQAVMRQVSKMSAAAALISDSSVETTSWPLVGQLSLPLSVYHQNYAFSQVDIDDNALWTCGMLLMTNG